MAATLEGRVRPLPLSTPFRIAHGTSTERHNLFARLSDGHQVAWGEGAMPPYYGFDAEAARAYVEALDPDRLLRGPSSALSAWLARLPAGPDPARCAVDLALHDLWGQRLGHPLYALWGLDPEDAPPSSLTLSIPATDREQDEGLEKARAFDLIKLKLGSGDPDRDLAIVERARAHTTARLGVDANGGWSVEEAASLIPRLIPLGLAFVEQPIRDEAPEAWHRLRQALPPDAPPLFADERIRTGADILALRGAIDGVNVKLLKAGGLRPAREQITLARALGMGVLLGCMIESSLALTAAAHLAPLADVVDLDAPFYLADDPFEGVAVGPRGRLRLPDRPGLGVRPR